MPLAIAPIAKYLDLYEQAFSIAGVPGQALRWRIEHAQHVDPADIGRFADLELSRHSKVFTVPLTALGSHCGLASSVAFKPPILGGI